MIVRFHHVKIILNYEIDKSVLDKNRKIITLNIISAIIGSFSVFGCLVVGNVSVRNLLL